MAIKVACRLLLLRSARGPQSSDMVVWWCWLLLRRLLLSRRPLRPEYPRTVGGGVVIEAPWLRSTSKCQRLRVPPQLNNTVCVLLSRRPLRPEYPRVQEYQNQRLKLLLLRGGGGRK
jgi:hypothetical protein